MLYITYTSHRGAITAQWHVGEPLPALSNRVVVFQADGDELELLLRAMRGSNPSVDGTVETLADSIAADVKQAVLKACSR